MIICKKSIQAVCRVSSITYERGRVKIKELSWKDVAGRLKALRKQHKLTIERLAEMISVSTSFIGLIEKGESGISLENLYKMTQVFNCSLDYIITGEGKTADTKFSVLNTALFDYSAQEIEFVAQLANFLRNKVNIKQ